MTDGHANVVRCGEPPGAAAGNVAARTWRTLPGGTSTVIATLPPYGARVAVRPSPDAASATTSVASPAPSVGGDGGAEAHAVDGVRDQHRLRRALADERLDRGPPDVGVEAVGRRRDLDHLVDALQRAGVGQRAGRPGQHGDGDRAAERGCGADQLGGDVAERTLRGARR